MRETRRPAVVAALALACAAGLLGGGTAQAAEFPYTPAEPTLWPGGCATAGELPWVGNNDLSLSVKAAGQGDGALVTTRFQLWKQGEEATPAIEAAATTVPGSTAWLQVLRDQVPEEGPYWWHARIEGAAGASDWSAPCGFRTDHTAPATPSVTFTDAGQYPQGAPPGVTRTVRFTLPAGTEATGFCFNPEREIGVSESGCDSQWVPVGADGTATATFVTPERSGPMTLYALAADRAGNISATARESYWIAYPFAEPFGDYTSDGRADLLGVGADGKLTLRAGQEGGGFGAPAVADGRDWSGAVVRRASWLTHRDGPQSMNDVRNDVVVLRDGKLSVYPGDGEGGFGAPVEIDGYDWSGVTDVTFNRGESSLLLAKEGDRLLLFDLSTYGQPRVIGEPIVLASSGWASKSIHFSDGPAESGMPFFWARDAKRGTLEYFPVEYGTTEPWMLGTPTTVAASGWTARQHPSVAVVGDLNGDGRSDLVSVDRSGALLLHPAAEDGSLAAPVTLQSSGWSGVAFF
ncbi:hypothetical protein ACF07V_13705 [Streptomyces sp. NPDC015661]|uniref:hypothetical protein n=1 Tax=Streptomyces sp. NPDC015661 TaxID=3364961 RepID=UPI0036F95D99